MNFKLALAVPAADCAGGIRNVAYNNVIPTVFSVHAYMYEVDLGSLAPCHYKLVFKRLKADVCDVARLITCHEGDGKSQHTCRETGNVENRRLCKHDLFAGKELFFKRTRFFRQTRISGNFNLNGIILACVVVKRLREKFPDNVAHCLLVNLAAGHDKAGVKVFKNNAELGEHSVRPVRIFIAAVAPEAVAVALL